MISTHLSRPLTMAMLALACVVATSDVQAQEYLLLNQAILPGIASPWAMTEDDQGFLYVGDSGHNPAGPGVIHKYNKDLEPIGTIPDITSSFLTGLAFAHGNLYLLDYGPNVLRVVSPETGELVGQFIRIPIVQVSQRCIALTYDPDADTFWALTEGILNPFRQVLFEFDFAGNFTGRSFLQMESVWSGVSSVDPGTGETSVLDLLTWDTGPVIARGNPAAGIPLVDVVTSFTPARTYRSGLLTSQRGGVEVFFVASYLSAAIYEIGPPPAMVVHGAGTVDAASGSPSDVLFVNRYDPSFSDDLESPDSGDSYTTSSPSGNADWAIIESGEAQSGTHVWHSSMGEDVIEKDDRLDLGPFTVTPDSTPLRFWHAMRNGNEGGRDGGVLEGSLDGGPFFDLGPDIVEGRYNRHIYALGASAIDGRHAWAVRGSSRVEVDLSPYLGHEMVIRWRLVTDRGNFCVPNCSGDLRGWYLDDISLGGRSGTGEVLRTVDVARGAEPFFVELEAPPLGPAAPAYAFYAWVREPTFGTVVEQPFDLGTTVLPIPLNGVPPRPKFILNTLGREAEFGMSSIPQGQVPMAPGEILRKSQVGRQITFTVQAILEDNGSLSTEPLAEGGTIPGSVTNAVRVRVR